MLCERRESRACFSCDCFSSLQSLEADDIASAVIYALSTPPRMEVRELVHVNNMERFNTE